MAEEYKGEAYCVKCKEKRSFEGHVKVSDSGRRMAQGICPVCGTKNPKCKAGIGNLPIPAFLLTLSS